MDSIKAGSGQVTHVCGLEGYGAIGDSCLACDLIRQRAAGSGDKPAEPTVVHLKDLVGLCPLPPGEDSVSYVRKLRDAEPAALKKILDEIELNVAELPDRSSPEDWPEAMLVTGPELRTIICCNLEEMLQKR